MQTCLCYFSGLLRYFFSIGHASAFFAFCCENWHKRWMNRHPVSLRGGQTFFFMAFHTILRQILNFGFSAISSHELSVCAIFYVFSNYGFRFILLLNLNFCSSQPSMVHWLSSPIFPCLVGCRPAMVTSDQISTSTSPRPPNPYIF